MENKKAKTVKEYIKILPKEPGKFISEMTEIIKKNAPDAKEEISYDMPTYRIFDRILAHCSAFKNHYSLFPGPDAICEFKEELREYETSKGTIKLSYNKPLPKGLIAKIIKYKVKINKKKANKLK